MPSFGETANAFRLTGYPIYDPFATAGLCSGLCAIPKPTVEHIARVLLKRYGVVFRKVLEREDGLPSWRELLYVYRRLEARGELRGGRFVQGFSGEQFALPEAVGLLRDQRKQTKDVELTVINAADPLNLTGIVTSGDRISAAPGQRIVYRNGASVAHGAGNKVHYLQNVDAEHQWQLQWALVNK